MNSELIAYISIALVLIIFSLLVFPIVTMISNPNIKFPIKVIGKLMQSVAIASEVFVLILFIFSTSVVGQSTANNTPWLTTTESNNIGLFIFGGVIAITILSISGYVIYEMIKQEFKLRQLFGNKYEQLNEQLNSFGASTEQKNHMKYRILYEALSNERQAAFTKGISVSLKTLNLIVNSLIPPITVAKLTIIRYIPLETEVVTALLASIGLIALNTNSILNLENKAIHSRFLAKRAINDLWSCSSLSGIYINMSPKEAAQLCLSRCEIDLLSSPDVEAENEQQIEDQNNDDSGEKENGT